MFYKTKIRGLEIVIIKKKGNSLEGEKKLTKENRIILT